MTCAMTQRCVHLFWSTICYLMLFVCIMQCVANHARDVWSSVSLSHLSALCSVPTRGKNGRVTTQLHTAGWLRWYFSSYRKISESMWKHSGTWTPIATMFLLPSTAHFPNRDTLQHDSKCLQNPSCHGAHGSLCIMTACKSSLLSFHPLPKIFPQRFYSKPFENKKKTRVLSHALDCIQV